MIDDSEVRVLGRREFSRESLLSLLGGLTITVSACSGGGSSPTAATPPAPAGQPGSAGIADVRGTVSANHGHVALVTGAQISAAGAVMLAIRGAADHDHQLSLSAAEMARLRDGQSVAVRSAGSQDHDHLVTFSRSEDGPSGPTYE